jgi:hypothetical protein
LTLAALYYRPSLDIARAKLAEAQAGVITARQIPNSHAAAYHPAPGRPIS